MGWIGVGAWVAVAGAQEAVAPGCAAFAAVVPSDLPCVPTRTTAKPEAGAALTVQVSMRVARPPTAGTLRPVSLTTPVCNGDLLAFTFTPSAPGYVVVLSHGTSGRWTRHLPAGKHEVARFGPEVPVRFPPDRGEVVLGVPVGGAPGTEWLMLAVSTEPFSSELQLAIDRLDGSYTPPAGGGVSADNHRALFLVGTEGQVVDHVTARGEQMLVVPIRHEEACGRLP